MIDIGRDVVPVAYTLLQEGIKLMAPLTNNQIKGKVTMVEAPLRPVEPSTVKLMHDLMLESIRMKISRAINQPYLRNTRDSREEREAKINNQPPHHY